MKEKVMFYVACNAEGILISYDMQRVCVDCVLDLCPILSSFNSF
jgi:hypothetical protein